MTFIERILRAMTHLNIGATIATAVWILWSGLVIVDPSHTALRVQPAQTEAPTRPTKAGERHEGHEGHTGHHGQEGMACPCDQPPLTTRAPSTERVAAIRVEGSTA